MRRFMNFLKDEEGATALEYGLIAALIAVAIVVAVQTLGGKVSDTFNYIAGQMPTVSST